MFLVGTGMGMGMGMGGLENDDAIGERLCPAYCIKF